MTRAYSGGHVLLQIAVKISKFFKTIKRLKDRSRCKTSCRCDRIAIEVLDMVIGKKLSVKQEIIVYVCKG